MTKDGNDEKICMEHKMCIQMIHRNEEDIQMLWNEINNMKKLAITTMVAVIIQMCVFVGNIVYSNVKNENNKKPVSIKTSEHTAYTGIYENY